MNFTCRIIRWGGIHVSSQQSMRTHTWTKKWLEAVHFCRLNVNPHFDSSWHVTFSRFAFELLISVMWCLSHVFCSVRFTGNQSNSWVFDESSHLIICASSQQWMKKHTCFFSNKTKQKCCNSFIVVCSWMLNGVLWLPAGVSAFVWNEQEWKMAGSNHSHQKFRWKN